MRNKNGKLLKNFRTPFLNTASFAETKCSGTALKSKSQLVIAES